uniref:G-protein coupled receptors family 3 profile domain-containing protein n=1 Tax=Meloidogyne javanica TaxID=6303 RepID=A0A915MA34_MELJA
MIIVIVREKRHEQNDRGWALMEAFFMGAIILYAIPLLGWPEHIPWSCWIADFGRQLGFTLFYGSVILKIYRYALNEVGSRDALFLVAVLQLHLTISLNIVAIIAPKFLFSTENTARGTLNSGNATAIIGSNRAHPSLAKMRENLINGTIDFQEVPIVDMNPEDIRAELKRVYTQLRMYKLKNAYQDNPHISKRKGGAGIKKVVHHQQSTTECNNNNIGGGGGKTSRAASASATIDRRISIPPQIINSSSNNSPNKFQQQQQKLIEEEKNNDLTVESAPHNIHLLTTSSNSSIKLNSPTDIPLISSSDQSIRV